MSIDIRGGIDYALLKRHYDCDDYVILVHPTTGAILLNGIPFTQTQTYYVVGLMAYLNDANVVDVTRGWTSFTHGEGAAPVWLQPLLAALGITVWPAEVPAFEAKDILFWADQDCLIQFEGKDRTRHFIPADTYMRFHRRHFKFYVTREDTDGTLRAWIEG